MYIHPRDSLDRIQQLSAGGHLLMECDDRLNLRQTEALKNIQVTTWIRRKGFFSLSNFWKSFFDQRLIWETNFFHTSNNGKKENAINMFDVIFFHFHPRNMYWFSLGIEVKVIWIKFFRTNILLKLTSNFFMPRSKREEYFTMFTFLAHPAGKHKEQIEKNLRRQRNNGLFVWPGRAEALKKFIARQQKGKFRNFQTSWPNYAELRQGLSVCLSRNPI